jgi:hypothetical protein
LLIKYEPKLEKMKTILKKTSFLLVITLLLSCCEKETDDNNDQCLILVKSNGFRYSTISPSTSTVLEEIEPNLPSGQIEQAVLGYQSLKTIITSKEPGGSYVKIIYSCDRETGNNLSAITSRDEWDVQSLSASSVEPKIVFHGHPVTGGSSVSNLFLINENGTGLQQITQNNEEIEGKYLTWPEYPSWSPNGQKIAFRGRMVSSPGGSPWWGRAIIVMNANGSGKQILYNESEVNSGYHFDISWTHDGKYLVFLTYEYFSTPKERVKVLNVENQDIIDITDQLLVEGKHTTNICTSPRENKILFNKDQPGGGDLYEIEYEISADDQFILKGPYKLKCEVKTGSLQFGSPNWQLKHN